MTQFNDEVYRVLKALRRGEVVSYGEVAREAGFPGAARAVGTYLARSHADVPWWRVVTVSGRLVPGSEERQARLLRAEGASVVDGRVSPAAVLRDQSPGSVARTPPMTADEVNENCHDRHGHRDLDDVNEQSDKQPEDDPSHHRRHDDNAGNNKVVS